MDSYNGANFVLGIVPSFLAHAFVWEKDKTMDFSETTVIYDMKLATETEVTRSFCWHQNFVPWGLYALYPGAIYMY